MKNRLSSSVMAVSGFPSTMICSFATTKSRSRRLKTRSEVAASPKS